MKTKLVELSDLTIKQYIERAKQVQKQLQSHKGEYMGIKNRMLARKEQGIKRAETKLQKSIKESNELRWVLYVDDMAVAHYSSKEEAMNMIKKLKPKYINVNFSIKLESLNDSTEKNQEKINNVKR